jgi:4-amino-4-deoxy-L-arabinose transferase-like glycosyltransferase
LIVLASAVGLVTLGRYDLRPWDEPFYALRARAVAEDDAWLDQNDYCPHRMANACYPPLFVWLAGATMKVLGPGEFAARLAAGLERIGGSRLESARYILFLYDGRT